jgi:hypothetical protein
MNEVTSEKQGFKIFPLGGKDEIASSFIQGQTI